VERKVLLKTAPALFLLLALVLGPLSAAAQEFPMGKWWHDRRAVGQLNLTDDEIRVLDEQYVKTRRILFDLKKEVDRQRFELDTLLEKDSSTRPELMSQFEKLENARADLSRVRFNFILEARETLGPERFMKLKLFFDALRGYRGEGPGRKTH